MRFAFVATASRLFLPAKYGTPPKELPSPQKEQLVAPIASSPLAFIVTRFDVAGWHIATAASKRKARLSISDAPAYWAR
jgi:hypothetical protein